MRYLPIALLLLFVFCTPQTNEVQGFQPQKLAPKELAELMTTFQQREGLRHAMLGAYVKELDSDSVWLDYNSQWGMATGSTMKAITTATALTYLGADFKFETKLAHSGKVEAGVLKGDLYIIGGGDPTLGIDNLTSVWQRWHQALRSAGIKAIEGNIIGDASIFEPYLLPRTWIWEDLGNYYGAGACGLNIHENYYSLHLKTSSPGRATQVRYTQPKVEGLSFTNELVSGPAGSGDEGYIFGAPFTYQRVLRGSIPPNRSDFVLKGALPDPALQTAQWFKAYLDKQGVSSGEAQGIYRDAQSSALTYLDTLASPPLTQIVDKTNTKSVNTYAEAMLKMLGKQLKKEGGTKAGAEAVTDYWAEQGLDMEGFVMEDGSGLSRFNGITPKQMVDILRTCAQKPWFQQFEGSLAVAGKTGTLRRMCRGKAAQGRIFAKSGYINRVRCYVGYADTYEGKRLAFAIMVNNFTGKYKSLTPTFEEFFNVLVQLDSE